jgi:hypothetical protein
LNLRFEGPEPHHGFAVTDLGFGFSPCRLRRDPAAGGGGGTFDYAGFGNSGATVGNGDHTAEYELDDYRTRRKERWCAEGREPSRPP